VEGSQCPTVTTSEPESPPTPPAWERAARDPRRRPRAGRRRPRSGAPDAGPLPPPGRPGADAVPPLRRGADRPRRGDAGTDRRRLPVQNGGGLRRGGRDLPLRRPARLLPLGPPVAAAAQCPVPPRRGLSGMVPAGREGARALRGGTAQDAGAGRPETVRPVPVGPERRVQGVLRAPALPRPRGGADRRGTLAALPGSTPGRSRCRR